MTRDSQARGRSQVNLAILDEQPSRLYPKVPTAAQATGSSWTSGAWRGIAAPKNMSMAIEQRLQVAVKKAYMSTLYQEFMTQRGFGLRWMDPGAFAAYMAKTDQELGRAMKAVGLAK